MDPKRILICDDEPGIVELVSEMLEDILQDFVPAQIEPFEDSMKGFDRLQNQPFDLAILDFKMPGIQGDKIVKKVRESSRENRDIPIILMSAYLPLLNEMKDPYFENVQFISKPFTKEGIEGFVKTALKK